MKTTKRAKTTRRTSIKRKISFKKIKLTQAAKKRLGLLSACLVSLLVGWLVLGPYFYHVSPLHDSVTKAVAVIRPTRGNKASGTIAFTQESDGVHVVANLRGLKKGPHGFHVHDWAGRSCKAHNGFGPHYNPTNQPHGVPEGDQHHAGDLGNIQVRKNGRGYKEFVSSRLKLNGPYSIIGRGIIIHEGEDDPVTYPIDGNAGEHVGCGVIGRDNPENY